MSTSKIPSILITGATGNIGIELARQLSTQGVPFRAMVRSLNNAKELLAMKGAEIVLGDFSNPDSVANALKGIDRAFLLTNSTEQAEALQSRFVDIATRTGVQHIVKLSQLAAEVHSPVRYLRYHAAVEQKIKESGIAYTFLRPNLFMQGLLVFRDSIIKQGKFFAPAGESQISLVDIRDIAAVAVQALLHSGHAGKIYDLTGPEALTHQQMAFYLSDALDRKIEFIHVSPEEMQQAVLSYGLPEWQAAGLIEDYAHYSRGEASAISTAIQDITSKRPIDFQHFSVDYKSVFSEK